jgi:DNA topoisomerase-2
MEAYEEDAYETPGDTYPITKFIDQELIRYSIDDCMRSLPNLLDGLKQSQRKILYAVFKKNLRQKSMKVAQLSGYVAEVSNYHHGEQCLYDTITKMAHHFVGSNNLPYLVRDGQFGSRSYLGKDAANARYIFTRKDPLCRLIFPDLDDKLLTHTLDDGDRVEPDYYVPVLPMILVNGCSAGIGTGWSCSVPCFHPLRLVDKILEFLDSKTKARDDDEAWIPWYRYFKGTISKKESRKAFTTTGILRGPGTYDLNKLMDKIQDKIQGKDQGKDAKSVTVKKNNEKLEKKCWCIEEIPVKESINRYKEFLEKIQEEKKIKNLKNYSSADSPLFLFEVVTGNEFQPTIESLKLTSEVSVSNLVLWSEEKKLVKYEGVPEIFYHFCERRMKMYKDRREYLLKTWRQKLVRMEAIYRFLREVAGGTLKVFKVPESEILSQLETKGYPLVEGTYDYLLTIRIRQFSKQNWEIHEKRIESLKRSIGIMERVTSSEMWKMDLVPFLKEYQNVFKEEEKSRVESLIDRIEKQPGFHPQNNMLWVPEEEEESEKEEKVER